VHSWKYLEQIAELPPRASATEGERQAATWLNERLEALGFDVETQPFASPRYTLYLGPVIVIAVILFALGLSKFMPALATLLAVAAAVPLVGELLGRAGSTSISCCRNTRRKTSSPGRPRRAAAALPT